ncbi:MAG TPA: hypothetical protein VF867_01330 [Arthrobacter sp.]
MSTARQPQGIPTGGQFATDTRSEPHVTLEATTERTAKDLQPGDVFPYSHRDTVHTVEVLRAPEPHTDVTGLPVLKIWCRTGGRDGWLVLGPRALTPEPDAGTSQLSETEGQR